MRFIIVKNYSFNFGNLFASFIVNVGFGYYMGCSCFTSLDFNYY